MADIINDFQSVNGKEKYGNISIPYASKLLSEIIDFLNRGGIDHNTLFTNIDTFRKFIKYPIDKDTEENLEKLRKMFDVQSDDTTKRMSFGDPLFRNQINIENLLSIVKHHLTIENEFLAKIMVGKTVDENEVARSTEIIEESILNTNELIGLVQKSINSINIITMRDFSSINVEKASCSRETLMFEGIQQLINKNKELNELRIKLDLFKKAGDLGVLKEDLNKLIIELEKKYKEYGVSNEKDLRDLIEYIRRLILKLISIGYIQEGIDGKLSLEDIIIRVYNNVIRPIMNIPASKTIDNNVPEIVKKMYAIKDSLPTRNMTKSQSEQQVGHHMRRYLDSYCSYVHKHQATINQKYIDSMGELCRMFGNSGENITPNVNSKCCSLAKQCCGSFKSSKFRITLKMIEDNLAPLFTRQEILSIPRADRDDVFMYVWHQLGLDDIFGTYKEYFMSQTTIDMISRFKTIKILDLDKEIEMIDRILDQYYELIEKINRLKDLIKLLEGTSIGELERRIAILQTEVSQLDLKHKRLIEEIEADLTKTITIFEQLIREMVDINKFYQSFDVTLVMYNDKLNQFFDVKTRNMNGGTRYQLKEFIELLNTDVSKSIAAHDKLMLYCRRSAILKSRYTLLYNRLRQYNKCVIDVVLFNLYKLTTFRDVILEKIVINRFIGIDELKKMKRSVDELISSNDEKKNKYAVIADISGKLFDSFFKKVTKLHDSDCVDIGLTNYIIDFILVINFCKKLA